MTTSLTLSLPKPSYRGSFGPNLKDDILSQIVTINFLKFKGIISMRNAKKTPYTVTYFHAYQGLIMWRPPLTLFRSKLQYTQIEVGDTLTPSVKRLKIKN